MKHTMQKGFTLIELMIVVAIIGILAAVAIPQYQNYVGKSQVARVVAESGALKTAVETCLLEGVAIAACDFGATGSTLVTGSDTSGLNGTNGVVANKTGVPVVAFGASTGTAVTPTTITSTLGNSAATALATKKVIWTRSGTGSWTCGTDVDAKFTAAGCPKL